MPSDNNEQHTVSYCLKYTFDTLPLQCMSSSSDSIRISPYDSVRVPLRQVIFRLLGPDNNVIFLSIL